MLEPKSLKLIKQAELCLPSTPATLFWLVGVPGRTAVKYPSPALLVERDAGFLAATITLVATAASLNTVPLGATGFPHLNQMSSMSVGTRPDITLAGAGTAHSMVACGVRVRFAITAMAIHCTDSLVTSPLGRWYFIEHICCNLLQARCKLTASAACSLIGDAVQLRCLNRPQRLRVLDSAPVRRIATRNGGGQLHFTAGVIHAQIGIQKADAGDLKWSLE